MGSGEQSRDDGFSRWSVWLLLPALGLFVVLACEVAARVKFPWDRYVWSESPFLTNMLRLNAGQPLYGDPADANSFVYAPGLEYLCRWLLHPFGRDLDIRFCRGVVVALGLAGCMASSRAGAGLLLELGVTQRSMRAFVPFGALLSALVLGRSFTADVCHPDNVMVCHVLVTFLLCWTASTKGGLPRAVLAVAFGSLGVFAKQTGAGTGLAALIGLVMIHRAHQTPRRVLVLASVTFVATGAAIASLLVPQNARFWTFDLMRAQWLDWEKTNPFFWGIAPFSHRVLLYTLAPIAVSWLFLRPDAGARRFATLWLVFALLACGPAMMALLKVFGSWNNLGIFDMWSVLVVAPVLWSSIAMCLDADGGAAAPARRVIAATSIGLLSILLLGLIPTRAWPTEAHYAAARELEAELTRAHRAGERVLLAHGTAYLVRAGYRDVPLDRANSVLELSMGKALDRAATILRIVNRNYDRVYLNAPDWYGALTPWIQVYYEEIGVILAPSARPDANGTEGLGDRLGYFPLVMNGEVRVLRKRPPPVPPTP